MSFRNERKYRLSYGDSVKLKSNLIFRGMEKLYPDREINSEYFDTMELKMFSDSEEGILPRKKIRVRWYQDKSIKNLETKISSIEGRFKKSVRYLKNLKEKSSYLQDSFYGKIFTSIIVNYKREYYQFKNFRLTFDTKINYKNSRLNSQIKYNDKETVLEIKTKNLDTNDYIDQFINYPTSRFSKYCRGIHMTRSF
jgi:hypothetical protein